MAHELEAKFIPNYTERSEAKRTREVVDSTDWNELWNLNSTQGDHSEMWVDAIYKYLFGSSNFDTSTTAKIAAIDTYAQTLNTLKEDKSTANLLCATIEYVDSTGVFTFKDRSGNVMKTVDLNIEKIPASITLVKVGDVYYLRIINTDGSYTECPVSTLFNPVSFATDAQHAISFDVVTAADGSKTVKAQIKDGMVTDNMLNSEVMLAVTAAKIAAEAARDAAQAAQSAAETAEDNAHDSEVAAAASQVAAAGSATNAAISAASANNSATSSANSATTASIKSLESEGWAVGKQNGIDVTSGSPYYHNNSKYYKDQAQSIVTADMNKSVYDTHDKSTDIFDYTDLQISVHNMSEDVHNTLFGSKADKDTDAVQNNVAKFDANGNPIDSGFSIKKSCVSSLSRWLRFNPSNHKGLIIKANTYILNSLGEYVGFATDTAIDLSSDISSNGTDYFVYMSNDGTIHAYTTEQASGVKIGRFHTLCVNAGNMTMILPPSGNSVGTNVMVKSYREDEDADFYAFYRKPVTASSSNNETVAHPLSGFMAGDILPESVFCLSWHPNALVEDAMVYDKDTDSCVDVYLQSGKGLNTRSKYNATHTVSRQQANHMSDMRMVGKILLSDSEFESASIGSNQATNITGSSDKGTVGGHVDTANRRMISAIGCEEMCGYLWQWTRDVSSTGGSSWVTTDGNGSFGQEYGTPYVLIAGGHWGTGSYCGSRCRASIDLRSNVDSGSGGRGLSRVVRGI